MKKLIPLYLILSLIAVSCSKKPAPAQSDTAPPVPVHTAGIEMRNVPLFFEAMGVVKPYQAVEIKSQVNGIIAAVHFHDGQWMEKGDLLYTIVEDSYAIKVQEMQALLLQDQAHLNNARKKLKRYKSLSSHDLIAQVEWDEVETQVALYKAMVKADKARLASAKLDLEHCRILSPLSGYAGKSAQRAGNMTDGSVLVTLSHPEPYHIDFAITEKELQRLPDCDLHVEIYSSGEEECLAKGEVVFLDCQLDPATGLLAARAVLSSLFKPLWGGQSVRVHVLFGEKKNAMLIPLKAIKTNQNGPYVYAAKLDGTVEILSVTLGPEEKGWIVVEEGLNEESKVVVEGHNRLYPGSKIEEAR
jgi:multidrug efflux system membrane fusion protein